MLSPMTLSYHTTNKTAMNELRIAENKSILGGGDEEPV